MSSRKTSKWSSSSLSKLLSRITRTLSFTSKKSQQTFKNNNRKVKPTEIIVKKVNFVPQSAPVFRRHPPSPMSKCIFEENFKKDNYHREMIYSNMFLESDIEEEDNEYLRYSLRPNLSLFCISSENLNSQSQESEIRPADWLDVIFHSTKIEDN